MKKFIVLLAFLPITLLAKDKVPAWMTSRVSDTAYIGVGSCAVNDPDRQEKAQMNALNDLARQISVLIETNSFLSRTETDIVREEYAQTITLSSKELLEGYAQAGSYTDTKNGIYYVCYQLDKMLYRLNKEKKSNEIADKGYSYLFLAEQAVQRGELMRSVTYYEKGLQEVEPWLFLDLRMLTADTEINVPVELYKGYVSVFDGMQLTVTPEQLQWSKDNRQVKVTVSRQGQAVPNIPVQAQFIAGTGIITEETQTSSNGTASFLISSVSAKNQAAQVRFTISPVVSKELGYAYRRMLSRQTWPEAVLTVETAAETRIAYLNATQDDLPAAYKQVGTLLGNHHFDLSPDPDEADIFIDWECTVDYAGIVAGEIQNLNESYVSLRMRFYDNKTQKLLTTYNVSNLRVLTPEKNSVEQTMAQCSRELMKRVMRELPKYLNF